MGEANIRLVCEVCATPFYRGAAEARRNEKLGRRVFCSLACSATFRNRLPASRLARAERNKNQRGDKNPNWKGGVSNSESVLRSRAKHPERHAARKALAAALKRGEIVKPEACEGCSRRRYLTAHHEDYDKPLAVDWLCPECHGEADTRLRETGRL